MGLGLTTGAWQERLALIGLALLAAATVWAFIDSAKSPRLWLSLTSEPPVEPAARREWLIAALVAAGGTATLAQSWFRVGTAIAAGDETVPEGTAWLGRLFDGWASTINGFGAPGNNELQLPWASVLWTVNTLGGSGGLAQRIWYTALFAGAAVAALLLLSTLGLRPLPAVIGAFGYVLSPYVMVAQINPVFLACLVLLAGLSAIILAVARGSLRMGFGVALLVATVPLIGYVDQNPPLVGALILATMFSCVLAALLGGRHAASRGLQCIAVAAPLMIAASAYWIIPSFEQFTVVASGTLASPDSWAFSQTRSTLANAFWLNTTWGWRFHEYYPYASSYDMQPLALVKFLLPAAAFAALALIRGRRAGCDGAARQTANSSRLTYLPLAAATSAVTLFVVFFSTGTRFPGSLLFNAVYQLPFGWLLREPGRFLMIGSLGYAVLLGLTVEMVVHRARLRDPVWLMVSRTRRAALCVVASAIVVLGPGYPLAVGAVVPDQTGTDLPSSHVVPPATWKDMAAAIDGRPESGAVVVLPPDDFYQMPYTWGYYGNDGFIGNLMHRPALVPNGQGYTPASAQLLNAVNLIAADLRAGDTVGAQRVMNALGTPLVLVRGDINAAFPGRSIIPPNELTNSLSGAPNFHLVHAAGPLGLYRVDGHAAADQETTSSFVTVNSDEPDLRVLTALAPDTHLVTAPPQPGVGRVTQVPGIETWSDNGTALEMQLAEEPGWDYRALMLGQSGTSVGTRPDVDGHLVLPGGVVGVERQIGASRVLSLSYATGKSAIDNGGFAEGEWSPVGDCDASSPGSGQLSGRVLPNAAPDGGSALRLGASSDSACEAQPLQWTGGPLVLRMQVHHVAGAAPRACLFEAELGRCLSMPDVPNGSGWSTYAATVTPDPQAKTLSLFLYADGEQDRSRGTRTVNEYAHVKVFEIPFVPQVDLIGTPLVASAEDMRLLVSHGTYSPLWQGPIGAPHRRVDGLVNGWVLTGDTRGAVTYRPDTIIALSRWMSVAAAVLAIVVLGISVARARRPDSAEIDKYVARFA
jgi:arabinofuranan 3-O-arabinosyltransferase